MPYRESSILANPVVTYIGVWSLVLVLYSLGLTNHFVEPSPIGLVTIFYGFVTSFLALNISRNVSKRKLELPSTDFIEPARRFYKILLVTWSVGSLVDIVYSGGIPLLWVIAGNEDKNYTNFGVPSLHGVLNACYLQAVTILFLCWCVKKNKLDLLLICALLIWPILMLGRGIFLSAAVQMTAVYLLMHRIRFKSVLWILFAGLLIIILFGFIGDLRDTPNPFDYLVEEKYKALFKNLPSGFLWVYVYSTSSLNNFFANVDSVVPGWLPIYSVSNMLPSVLRTAFGLDPRNDLFFFVDQNLNTSTAYAGIVSDFGPVGAIVSVFVIQQVASIFYIKAKAQNISGILGYSVMFQVLLFSVFYDMFFLLPTLMQIALVSGFSRYSRRHYSRNRLCDG